MRPLRASRSSSKLEEEDQERLLRLGGDLLRGDHLGGDRLGDLLMGDRRPRLRDLTLTEPLGDLNLDGRCSFSFCYIVGKECADIDQMLL